jgi:membrane-associated phospholipid phosphatase
VSASPHGTDGHDSEARPTDDPADHDHDLIAEESAPGATTVVESRQAPDLPAEPPAPDGKPDARRRIRDEIGARSRLIAVLLTASFLYIVVDIFVKGPLTQLDIQLHNWDGQTEIPSLDRAAWIYDKMGQRSVLVPILLIVAGVFARRHRTWRPVVLAAMSFLVLNVVVGAIKLLIGRAQTETGSPDVLSGGVIFPSGHSSNMVLTGGVIVYLFLRYARNPPLRTIAGVWAVLTTLTCLTSVYIGSHWLTDLIAGALVGGLLLQSVILFDIATKDVRYTRPWWWRRTVALLPFLETDRDRVDAVAVTGGRLGGVVEDVPEVRAAPGAAGLDATHAE